MVRIISAIGAPVGRQGPAEANRLVLECVKNRMRDDVKAAFRSLRSSRTFTTVALLVLALGIGASTAVFSVVDAVVLRALPFDACVWECPPVTAAKLSRSFECVFLESPSLAGMRPEPEVFAEHFRPDRSVVSFSNLGGDAVLVAPCPAGDDRDFSHLAQFVRSAAPAQQVALWQAVGEAMSARVGTDPVWLNTAGHGVAWLHVRLDSTPKYYRHDAYRRGAHDGR